MYNGIVLNETQQNAFLSIAASEGLICENGMTDGIFRSRTESTPSHQLVMNVFEQFMVSGTVFVDPFTYKCLAGELIEKGIILPYKEPTYDLDFQYFDVVTVQHMLKESDRSPKAYTEWEILDTYHSLKQQAIECISFEEECGLGHMEIEIQCLLGIGVAENPKFKDKVNRYIQLYNEIYQNAIFKVLSEYRKLLNIAYANDLLCPVISTIKGTKRSVWDSGEAVRILKYTSERLSKISTAGTLKDNIHLTQSDEAKAYRNKINEWMVSLSEQDFNNMQIIEDEIIKVQKTMKYKKHTEIAGKICATIGSVSSILSHGESPSNKLAVVIAEVMTYIGTGIAFWDPAKRKKYLWASFGLQQGIK